MHPKINRIVDKGLMETVRTLICLGCASIDPEGARAAMDDNRIRSHPHHVITKAHGGGDVPENLMPLCFDHHRLVHGMGLTLFSEKFVIVKNWLEGAGWEFNGVTWEEPACVYLREVVNGNSEE